MLRFNPEKSKWLSGIVCRVRIDIECLPGVGYDLGQGIQTLFAALSRIVHLSEDFVDLAIERFLKFKWPVGVTRVEPGNLGY